MFKKRQEEEDEDEALKADAIDEDAGSGGGAAAKKDKLRMKRDGARAHSGPILTAASMSLIKFIGEYLQIMQVLVRAFGSPRGLGHLKPTPPLIKSRHTRRRS